MAEGDFVDGGDLSQGVVECQYTDILLIAKPRTKIPLVGQQKSTSSNELYLDSRMLDQQFDLVDREEGYQGCPCFETYSAARAC
jgi:hypothetical protein